MSLSILFDLVLVWLFPILAFVCLGFSFYWNDRRSFSGSTFFMAMSGVLTYMAFKNDINTILQQHGAFLTIALLAAGYVVAGIATSFIYWIFFNWKAKERFDDLMAKDLPRWIPEALSIIGVEQTPGLSNSLKKYIIAKDHIHYVLDDSYSDFDVSINTIDFRDTNYLRYDKDAIGAVKTSLNQETLDAIVATVLPPRFKACKSYIIGAGCSWPITLIWLLISRVVKQLIERVVSMFGGTFDKISTVTFGKF